MRDRYLEMFRHAPLRCLEDVVALAAAAGADARVSVDVRADDISGTLAVVSVAADGERVELEARIRAVMADFTAAYVIEWI